jgi:SAM-dependent methyltransferase
VRRPEFIARQSAHPTGLIGRFIASVMAKETASANTTAVERLAPKPADVVLEIGFGHGATITGLVERVGDRGLVCGVDVSESMVRMAAKRNHSAVERGLADLRKASADELPYPDSWFDKVLSVHTLYFWTDLAPVFREVSRILKPGGRLLLGYRHDAGAIRSFPDSVYRFRRPEEVEAALRVIGFGSIETSSAPSGGAQLWFTIALRPES